MPDIGRHVNCAEKLRLGEQVRALQPKEGTNVVKKPVGCAEAAEKAADNHYRYKIGQIRRGLHIFFEQLNGEFIEQQRKYDRRREAENQLVNINQ